MALVHGRAHSYRALGCRCEDCRKAYNKSSREAAIRRKAAYIYSPADDHGTTRIYQRGCKCVMCKKAQSQCSRDYVNAEKSHLGRCEICAEQTTVVWDHDHATGDHRGWLCRRCNKALGAFRDDVGLLHRAAEYLK